MEISERILLRRFAQNKDAEAFTEIVQRYADPVYNTCRRILYDEVGAADAAQETFFQLMRSAGSIKGSLAGWLHSVATHKSIEAVRRNTSRRSREQKYVFIKSREIRKWKDISPYIDQELEKLSPEHKQVLIRYFFEGKTMADIAAMEQVSQPTVSRMVAAGVKELQKRFRKKGFIISSVILWALIQRNTLYAAPALVLSEVGKISLVGATTGLLTPSAVSSSAAVSTVGLGLSPAFSTGTFKTAVNAALSTFKGKVVTLVAITAVGTGAVITYTNSFDPSPEITAEPISQTVEQVETVEPADQTIHQPIALSSMTGVAYGGMGTRAASTDEVKLKLTDPEMTMDVFTDILVADNLEKWADCFVDDSPAYADMIRIMNSPNGPEENRLQQIFSSVGAPVELLALSELENRLSIKLLYTVYDPFSTIENNETFRWQEGDQFEINAELVCVDKEWKILNIYTGDRPQKPALLN